MRGDSNDVQLVANVGERWIIVACTTKHTSSSDLDKKRANVRDDKGAADGPRRNKGEAGPILSGLGFVRPELRINGGDKPTIEHVVECQERGGRDDD